MAAGNKHLHYKEALNALEKQSPGTKTEFYFGFLKRAAARFRDNDSDNSNSNDWQLGLRWQAGPRIVQPLRVAGDGGGVCVLPSDRTGRRSGTRASRTHRPSIMTDAHRLATATSSCSSTTRSGAI